MKLLIFTFLIALSSVCGGLFNSLPCNCRLGNLDRIVNGNDANAHSIPWMVSLANNEGFHFCGATIINEKYILTAAHCVNKKFNYQVRVRVGVHDKKKIQLENVRYVEKIIQAANYQTTRDFGDFALLELTEPIKFEKGKIEPACLNLKNDKLEGDFLSAGWGLTESPWKYSDKPEETVNRPISKDQFLKYHYSTQTFDNCEPHDICTEAKNEGDSSCSGDSGGPLMHTKKGKTSVVGVLSFTTAKNIGEKRLFCAGNLSASNVKFYKDFLNKHAGKYCKA